MLLNNYLLTNIGQIHGILETGIRCLKGKEMNHVQRMDNAYIRVENGKIADFGPMQNLPDADVRKRDLKGKWVLPGFVDSHTHMVFASARHSEFVMRLQGKTYEQIASEGGGILNSAAKLQNMEEDHLYEKAYIHALKAIQCGSTALEIKSGYGLQTEAEIKMLRVIKRLKQNLPITVKSTFLGAHAFPEKYKKDHQGYLDLLIHEMLPRIHEEKLADFIDVFCDLGFFNVEETGMILEAGEKYGLRAKIHGNELGISGGVQVAVKHKALSVDHLEHIGEQEIDCLLNSETMPVALPGSSFFLKIPYTPARKMIDAGLPMAIASDFNPGSSPSYNLWFTWTLACLYNGMTPAEGFNALTMNAAYALGLESSHGSISKGKNACFIITEAFADIAEMPYWISQNHASEVLTSK